MKRRTFLRHTAHAIGIPAMIGASGLSSFARSFAEAAGNTDKVLVLIYMQGGNDGLNTVIPLDQLDALNAVRPHVILPEDGLLHLPGTNVALHPKLTGLNSLFAEDRLRVVQNVGYPEPNYSHFRSTDIWMSGSDAETLVPSGWAGRYLEHQFPGYPEGFPNETTTDPLAIEIGHGSTMLFQGQAAAMSMVLKDPTSFYDLLHDENGELPDTTAGDKLRHIRMTARQSQQYGEVVKQAAEKVKTQQSYPENDLAEQLKIVAQLIAGGLKTPLYFVRLRGFDTHDNQVDASDHTTGEHADLLTQVDSSILAFMRDLEFLGVDDRVTGMTFSEFGRRIISNSSYGTDHGAAAPLFVFGNHVVPGVLGNNPQIPTKANYKDNLAWEFDFKQVYGSVLEQWFGLDEMDRNTLLFNDFSTLPVLKSSIPVSNQTTRLNETIRVYPNPLQESATVSFYATGEKVSIEAMNIEGRKISTIYLGKPAAGKIDVRWDATKLPAGAYYVVIREGHRRNSLKVLKVR